MSAHRKSSIRAATPRSTSRCAWKAAWSPRRPFPPALPRAARKPWNCATAIPARYGGKGVLKAVAIINNELSPELIGRDASAQTQVDHHLCHLDGTANKSRLGANTILSISLALARAAASTQGVPLYAYLRGLAGWGDAREESYLLPIPMLNVLNGGRHASNNVDFQEFMLYPSGAPSFAEALRWGTEIYHTLKTLLCARGAVHRRR